MLHTETVTSLPVCPQRSPEAVGHAMSAACTGQQIYAEAVAFGVSSAPRGCLVVSKEEQIGPQRAEV